MSDEPYCVWCNRIGHAPTIECQQRSAPKAASPKPAPDAMREARLVIEAARNEIVLTIAFLGRDGGTERAPKTIKSLIGNLAKAGANLRAYLANGSAPVPPAADGMVDREALIAKYRAIHSKEAQFIALCIKAWQPMPPADGAAIRRACTTSATLLRHASTTMQNDDYSKPHTNERARLISRIDAILGASELLDRLALSPSATGAAEPDGPYYAGIAFRNMPEHKGLVFPVEIDAQPDGTFIVAHLYANAIGKEVAERLQKRIVSLLNGATPPVRGGREAIKRAFAEKIRLVRVDPDDPETLWMVKPESLEAFLDAIPVQSGAGEHLPQENAALPEAK